MNRRTFLTGSMAVAALSPTVKAAALDIAIPESPIMRMFEMLPGDPGTDGFDFPVTSGANGHIQRSVWPENPDMYWDPEGEDYDTIFGIYPTWMNLSGTQNGVSLWQMKMSAFDRDVSQTTLESNGWKVVDDDLRILRYGGSEDERSALAGSLNILGSWMRQGDWDWVALPDDSSLVVGSDEDRVRIVADRVKNHTAMTTVDERFHQLGNILRTDSYLVSLLPPQRLPVDLAEASFVSRSWTGDEPIIHSIGLRLESGDQVLSMIDSVQERLETQISTVVSKVYADFLKIADIANYRGTVRFDLIDTSGNWDIFRALGADDLGMLPLLDGND